MGRTRIRQIGTRGRVGLERLRTGRGRGRTSEGRSGFVKLVDVVVIVFFALLLFLGGLR